MYAGLSALIILFTVRSASLYCSVHLSFSLSDMVSITFLFRAFLFLMACQESVVIHSFLFFCRRLKQVSLVWVYAVLTWSHMVLIPVVYGSVWFSASASAWNLFFS